jgi:hypothetical protein
VNHFQFLINCVTFDDRKPRIQEGKFTPMIEIWNVFILNCTRYCTPHENCTSNEQILWFRGKCPFNVNITSKAEQYGIKIKACVTPRVIV